MDGQQILNIMSKYVDTIYLRIHYTDLDEPQLMHGDSLAKFNTIALWARKHRLWLISLNIHSNCSIYAMLCHSSLVPY